MEDPQPSQLYDPQQRPLNNQSFVRQNARYGGWEEQQAPPAQPAVQPMPMGQPTPAQPGTPATGPAPQPAGPPGLTQPRRPVFVESLPDLGIVVISGDNPEDIAAIEAIIKVIQDIAKGSEAKIEIVPLDKADATSVTSTLNQVFARVKPTPSGNILIPSSGRPTTPATTGTTGITGQPGAGTVPSAVADNVVLIPLPRLNAILVAAQESRMDYIKGEIKKLDRDNAGVAGAQAFPLTKASASQVATLLTQFYAQRYPGDTNLVRVTFDASSNTVFVQAGPADLAEIKGLIDKIDGWVSSATNDLRIVHLRNALADELTNTILTAITSGVVPPGTTAAPGLIPTPGTQAGTPGTGARPTSTQTSTGLTTKTTSLRFFSSQPGQGQPVSSGMLEDVHITADVRSNSMIISAPAKTMELILSLIRELDVPAAAQASINIFSLHKSDAVQTATLLQQLFTGAGGTTTTGAGGTTLGGPTFTPASGAAPAGGLARPLIDLGGGVSSGASLIDLRMTVDNRTNSIIVAGSSSDLQVIEAIIYRLEDANVPSRQSQVYRLHNQAAADVATALQTFMTTSLNVIKTANQNTAFQELMRDVVIVPEPISNTLLISASPQYFMELYRIIEQMDQMPPQVVIQVLVAEVTLNDDQEFGVEMGLQSPVLFNRSLFTSQTTTAGAANIGAPGFLFNSTSGGASVLPNSTNFSPGIVGVQGISNLNVGRISPNGGQGGFVFSAQSRSFSLLIRALKTQGRLDVLSCPQVMTLDSQTAAVSIGQDVPIVGSTNVTATGLVTTAVDRRNVGVLLRVTPRITPDGKVLMRVFPEISTVIPQPVTLAAGVTSTAFNIQQVETSCVAQDGETVVIGGMIQQSDDKVENKIPCLGDLPYIGGAFRYRTQVRLKREILVILTPRVVRSQADADRVLVEEANRVDWLRSDVNKIYGPADLHKIVPGAQLPPSHMPIPIRPALCPDGSPLAVGPGQQIAPNIPGGPLMPMLYSDPAAPPKDSGVPATAPTTSPPPVPQPQQPPTGPYPQPGPATPLGQPTPMNPPVTPPPYDASQAAGPSLNPASYTAPPQPAAQDQPQQPQGKEPSKWKLFHRN
jgi:type II secretion system protein D